MDISSYIQKYNKTHIIFDFDETLVQLILPWDDCLNDIKKELIDTDEEIYNEWVKGKIVPSYLQNLYVEKYGESLRRLLNENTVQFESTQLHDVLYNNQLLDLIRNRIDLHFYLWSSNAKSTVEKVLKEQEILEKFEKVITREDVFLLKPHIDGFSLITEHTIEKERFLFVGDSSADQNAAKQLGIYFYKIDYFAQ